MEFKDIKSKHFLNEINESQLQELILLDNYKIYYTGFIFENKETKRIVNELHIVNMDDDFVCYIANEIDISFLPIVPTIVKYCNK